MRIIPFPELKSTKGIKFSRQHIHRLCVAKQFPRPVKVGVNSNGWVEEEIDQYLIQKIKERDLEVA